MSITGGRNKVELLKQKLKFITTKYLSFSSSRFTNDSSAPPGNNREHRHHSRCGRSVSPARNADLTGRLLHQHTPHGCSTVLPHAGEDKKKKHARTNINFSPSLYWINLILLFSDAQIITGPPWSFATKAATPVTLKSSWGFTRRKVLSRLSIAVKWTSLVRKRCHLEDCKDPEKKTKNEELWENEKWTFRQIRHKKSLLQPLWLDSVYCTCSPCRLSLCLLLFAITRGASYPGAFEDLVTRWELVIIQNQWK